MSRKTNKGTPWEAVPELWADEKAYCNWLRGQIRKMWTRHPVKTSYVAQRPSLSKADALKNMKIVGVSSIHGSTKELKQCEMCELWFPKGRMEVDHLNGGEGFSTYEEFLQWQRGMLFLGFDDIQHICKVCHHQVSLSQKFHCSLEEVIIYIRRAEFRKAKAIQQGLILMRVQQPVGPNAEDRENIYCRYLQKKYGLKFNDREYV